jgi:uncharacterized protein (DUF1697 family)
MMMAREQSRSPQQPARYVALLRAVNLAGHNRVAMAALRDLCTGLGFLDSQTLLQSGNIVFGSRSRDAAELERTLEAELAEHLEVETEFMVRSAAEWQKIVAGKPFITEAKRDPGHLLLMVLKQAVSAQAVKELQAAISGREVVRGAGREVYIVYPDGVGRSRLTNAVIEKKLGARATGRNWNSVLKLQALAEAM